MRNIKTLLLGLFVLCSATAYADFDLKSWEYKNKINLVGQTDGYVSLNLPSEIISHLRSDFNDLRIVNEDGETPYILKVESGKKSTIDLPANIYDLGTIFGKATSFVADVGRSGFLHSRVTIETPSQNFRRGVEIYSSDDKINWQLINSKGQIFDFNTTVNYPESSKRYLRIIINDFGDTPLNIAGATVTQVVAERSVDVTYNPVFLISEDDKNKITDIVADLGESGVPTSGGELKTSAEIFSRAVTVSESSDKKVWDVIGNGYIFSLDTAKFAGANLKFSYNESNKRFIKISVRNGDDRPIKFEGITLTGVARSVVFKSEPGKNYFIYSGNPKATKPEYDIAKLGQYLDAKLLEGVSIGVAEKNLNFVSPKMSLTEKFPQAITIALVSIVLLLAGLVVKLFTSVK